MAPDMCPHEPEQQPRSVIDNTVQEIIRIAYRWRTPVPNRPESETLKKDETFLLDIAERVEKHQRKVPIMRHGGHIVRRQDLRFASLREELSMALSSLRDDQYPEDESSRIEDVFRRYGHYATADEVRQLVSDERRSCGDTDWVSKCGGPVVAARVIGEKLGIGGASHADHIDRAMAKRRAQEAALEHDGLEAPRLSPRDFETLARGPDVSSQHMIDYMLTLAGIGPGRRRKAIALLFAPSSRADDDPIQIDW